MWETNMLTPRERVQCAMNHEEPDRVPFFLGTSSPTTMLGPAYDRFKAHLGIRRETRLFSKAFQYAELDEDILQRFGSDGRPIYAKAGPATLRREVSESVLIDDWGITWERKPSSLYYEIAKCPLRGASIDDLEKYPWPDLAHPSRFVGLADEARRLHDETPYAVVALGYMQLFDMGMLLRGLDQWMLDLAGDPEFAHALLRKVTDMMTASARSYLAEVGPYIDLITISDDLGTQKGPMISPKMYREMIKPYHAELISAIKEKHNVKTFFHSCGDVYRLIPDLIEVGVDVLNPVQVSAGEMADTVRLKREYGGKLTFCGGIDTRWVMPCGTTDDVRAEVRRRITDLAPGGGYIAATVHCIQPDVPPENVVAMCEEVRDFGRYPLAGKA
jgi:uroporphyrinogen decarboxylase